MGVTSELKRWVDPMMVALWLLPRRGRRPLVADVSQWPPIEVGVGAEPGGVTGG